MKIMINQDILKEKYPFLEDSNSWFYFFESQGKKTFGEKFFLDPYDHEVIMRMGVYVRKSSELAHEYTLNLDKGIFLIGPIGCGKTSFILILRTLEKNQTDFKFISAIEISNEYSINGPITIRKYVNEHKILCIDDIGREGLGRYFGKTSNVISEIIRGRYDRKMAGDNSKTFATSNFGIDDLLNFYSEDICSRMRTLFNLVAFHSDAKDKRK